MKAVIQNIKVLLVIGLFSTLSVGCSDLGDVTSLEGRTATGEECEIDDPEEVQVFVEWGCNGGDHTPPGGDEDDDDGGDDDGGDDDGGDDDGGDDDGGDDEQCDEDGCCIDKEEVQDQVGYRG